MRRRDVADRVAGFMYCSYRATKSPLTHRQWQRVAHNAKRLPARICVLVRRSCSAASCGLHIARLPPHIVFGLCLGVSKQQTMIAIAVASMAAARATRAGGALRSIMFIA